MIYGLSSSNLIIHKLQSTDFACYCIVQVMLVSVTSCCLQTAHSAPQTHEWESCQSPYMFSPTTSQTDRQTQTHMYLQDLLRLRPSCIAHGGSQGLRSADQGCMCPQQTVQQADALQQGGSLLQPCKQCPDCIAGCRHKIEDLPPERMHTDV